MTLTEFRKLVRWARKNGIASFSVDGMSCTFVAAPQPRQPKSAAPQQASNIPPDIDADFANMLKGLAEDDRKKAMLQHMATWSA